MFRAAPNPVAKQERHKGPGPDLPIKRRLQNRPLGPKHKRQLNLSHRHKQHEPIIQYVALFQCRGQPAQRLGGRGDKQQS